MEGILGLLKFQIFWVLKIPDIFVGLNGDAWPEPTYEEQKVPHQIFPSVQTYPCLMHISGLLS